MAHTDKVPDYNLHYDDDVVSRTNVGGLTIPYDGLRACKGSLNLTNAMSLSSTWRGTEKFTCFEPRGKVVNDHRHPKEKKAWHGVAVGRSVNLSRSAVLRGLPGANGFVLSFLTKPSAAARRHSTVQYRIGILWRADFTRLS